MTLLLSPKYFIFVTKVGGNVYATWLSVHYECVCVRLDMVITVVSDFAAFAMHVCVYNIHNTRCLLLAHVLPLTQLHTQGTLSLSHLPC